MRIPIRGKQKYITGPHDVHNLLQSILKKEAPEDRDKEHFWVLLLNADSTIRALDLVFLGTIDSTLSHPREIFTRAVSVRCTDVIVAHNHPSGNLEPSREDVEVTRTLIEAGEILQINVLDHIITTKKGFTSLRARGCLT